MTKTWNMGSTQEMPGHPEYQFWLSFVIITLERYKVSFISGRPIFIGTPTVSARTR
jgi:hypothetical protein